MEMGLHVHWTPLDGPLECTECSCKGFARERNSGAHLPQDLQVVVVLVGVARGAHGSPPKNQTTRTIFWGDRTKTPGHF